MTEPLRVAINGFGRIGRNVLRAWVERGFDPALKLSERIAQTAYRNGLIFRAFTDNILGFAPALCFTQQDFELLFQRLTRTLDEVADQKDVRAAMAQVRAAA